MGDRSANTFKQLWNQVSKSPNYFYVTHGYKVYPMFVNQGAQIVSKTYMMRVEG